MTNLVKRIISRSVFRGKKNADDFDWNIYHLHYKQEKEDAEMTNTEVLQKDDYVLKDNQLVQGSDTLPLHPNYRLLYETILQLRPKSAIEVGCGWGDHLHNISLLYPEVQLAGCEISSQQLDRLKKRHPDLNADTFLFNATHPFSYAFRQYDLAYTHAVIMHIQAGSGHLVALANLFRFAEKYVVLMENWTKHQFMEDILFLKTHDMLPWKNVYVYYRVSPELAHPHLMVVSSIPLPEYQELDDYGKLLP